MRFPTDKKSAFISHIGMFTAVLAVLSFFETRLGFNFGVPGVKFGFSNIVIIIALTVFGFKTALCLTAAKIGFSFVFTGGMSGMIFTFFGSISSLFSMFVIKKALGEKVSCIGMSAAGGFCHITAQYLTFGALMKTAAVMRLYPLAVAISLVTAVIVGIICNILLKRVYT